MYEQAFHNPSSKINTLFKNFVKTDKLKSCFINERIYTKVLICHELKMFFKDVYVGCCFLFSATKVASWFPALLPKLTSVSVKISQIKLMGICINHIEVGGKEVTEQYIQGYHMWRDVVNIYTYITWVKGDSVLCYTFLRCLNFILFFLENQPKLLLKLGEKHIF